MFHVHGFSRLGWLVFYYIAKLIGPGWGRVFEIFRGSTTTEIPNEPKGKVLQELPWSPGRSILLLYNISMIELTIPGRGEVQLEHLVCDVNGTLALDGQLPDGMLRALNSLRDRLTLHLLTADTHGRQSIIDQQLNLRARRIQPGQESEQKAKYIQELGADRVVAIGQGANDAEMLHCAALGICVLSPEGTAVETLLAADLVTANIFDALELLEKPLRIVATLRK